MIRIFAGIFLALSVGTLIFLAISGAAAWGLWFEGQRMIYPPVSPVTPQETCWSGTFAVQLPEMPEGYWVAYADKGATNLQICGVGLRVGDIIAFPDLATNLIDMENQRNAWRDCALDGPPLCPEEYKSLKAKR